MSVPERTSIDLDCTVEQAIAVAEILSVNPDRTTKITITPYKAHIEGWRTAEDAN